MILDRDFFQASEPDFEIMSFEILPTEKAPYDKLLVSTKQMQLYAVNYRKLMMDKKRGVKSNDQYVWHLDLAEEIAEQDLYQTENTILEKTYTIGCFPVSDEETDYITLIHTSDTAIYLAKLNFNTDIEETELTLNFLSAYNNYGNFISQISLKGNFDANSFAEVYKNPDEEEFLLAVYTYSQETLRKIHSHESLNTDEPLTTEPMVGALEFKHAPNLGFNENYEWYQDSSNQWHILLVDPLNQTLMGAKIRDFPVLSIQGNVSYEQKIRLNARSEHALTSDYFESEVRFLPPPNPPKKKDKMPWWAILLIVIGSLLFIGGGVFVFLLFKKKRQNTSQDVSMQEHLQA